MSGAEAAFVFGLISGVISICQATKSIYEAAKDAKGQPEAFRQVYTQLGLVIVILDRTKEKAKKVDETSQDALEPILESCKAKAENLNKIFQKVIRKYDKWYDQYKKVLGTLGKGQKVETLMAGILTDIQVLACEKLTEVATEAQVKEIKEAIKEMDEMPSSLQDETGGAVTQNHEGSGSNYANTAGGFWNSGSGNLTQNDIKGDAHFGKN